MTGRRRRRPGPQIHDLGTHQGAYVTLPSLKAYWQVEYQTLRKWVQGGYLPAYRFGRLWRVRTADALAFERQNLYKAS